MADEAVIIELGETKGNVLRYTVADGVAVEKGTLMHVLDPRTAVKTANDFSLAQSDVYFAGIASTEKVLSDGQVTLGLYTTGVFDILTCPGSAAISAGELVVISGANMIDLATSDIAEDQGKIVGKALEDSAADSDETIAVLLGVR